MSSAYIESFLISLRPPHSALTIARVPKIDVNIEVKIPIASVTAKPLIAPVPTANKIIAVIKVVILASAIVESAFE